MSLRDLYLRKAYSSDSDDILDDFYVPVLKVSIAYDRLAGFFSSTSLAIAARGILGLIGNGGVVRLIVSPRLSREDLAAMLDSFAQPEAYIERKMVEELQTLEDQFIRDHVYALGWMVANDKLHLKVAIAYDNEGYPLSGEDIQRSGLFHQKVGILKDSEGSVLTFSGSVNETASAWLENIEEFKVFRSWVPAEQEYVEADVSKFEKFWNSDSQRVTVVDIPRAVREKLIEIAPADIAVVDLERHYKKWRRKPVRLFPEQSKAVDSWVADGMRGILEMATGTGKTFTALGCLDVAMRSYTKLVTVISCPYQHLVSQWQREIGKFGTAFDELIVADSSNRSWKDDLAESLIDVSIGHKTRLMVVTTHDTLSSHALITIVRDNKGDASAFLIGDEVHGLGSEKRKRGLLNEYDLRLGLSATPRRWFDEAGTKTIYDYFGETVHEFGLAKAVTSVNPATGRTYLTPYRYVPVFVGLTPEELEEYVEQTKAIGARYSRARDKPEIHEIVQRLLFRRADIVKNAQQKYSALSSILDDLGPSVCWTLIYCIHQQIDKVMQMLNESSIVAHRFTMDEGTTPETRYRGLSERDFLLKAFADGTYQVLVAMKCLDEGVDVPPARTAILMASSGNPREYVQRIGRVIRQYPGKSEATIYDIVVVPSFGRLPPELRAIERRIFSNELRRYKEIATIASNGAEAFSLVCDIQERSIGVEQ